MEIARSHHSSFYLLRLNTLMYNSHLTPVLVLVVFSVVAEKICMRKGGRRWQEEVNGFVCTSLCFSFVGNRRYESGPSVLQAGSGQQQ